MQTANSYDELGEFHDLFMAEAWQGLRPLVRAAYGALGPEAVVLEVGAGTGLGTRVLAQECPAQIIALEPNPLMRSVLTARVADDPDLAERVSVVAGAVPQDLALLPEKIDAVVCTHVLGHLGPTERRALFGWVADSLSPDGVVLVTTQEHAEPGQPGPSDLKASRRLGRYEYTLLYREAPAGDTFSSRYEVWERSSLLRAVEVTGAWRTVSLADLEADVEGTTLTVVSLRPGAALARQRSGHV